MCQLPTNLARSTHNGIGRPAGVLWALTMLASDAPWAVITLFWLGASAVFLVWSGTDTWRLAGRSAARLEAALRTDRARDAAVVAEAAVARALLECRYRTMVMRVKLDDTVVTTTD